MKHCFIFHFKAVFANIYVASHSTHFISGLLHQFGFVFIYVKAYQLPETSFTASSLLYSMSCINALLLIYFLYWFFPNHSLQRHLKVQRETMLINLVQLNIWSCAFWKVTDIWYESFLFSQAISEVCFRENSRGSSLDLHFSIPARYSSISVFVKDLVFASNYCNIFVNFAY